MNAYRHDFTPVMSPRSCPGQSRECAAGNRLKPRQVAATDRCRPGVEGNRRWSLTSRTNALPHMAQSMVMSVGVAAGGIAIPTRINSLAHTFAMVVRMVMTGRRIRARRSLCEAWTWNYSPRLPLLRLSPVSPDGYKQRLKRIKPSQGAI